MIGIFQIARRKTRLKSVVVRSDEKSDGDGRHIGKAPGEDEGAGPSRSSRLGPRSEPSGSGQARPVAGRRTRTSTTGRYSDVELEVYEDEYDYFSKTADKSRVRGKFQSRLSHSSDSSLSNKGSEHRSKSPVHVDNERGSYTRQYKKSDRTDKHKNRRGVSAKGSDSLCGS